MSVIELRVAITTTDFERLKRFYCDGLGLEPAEVWTSEQDSALLIELGRGTMEILDEAHSAKVDEIEAGRRVSGQIRFAIQVPDLQAALDRVLAKGAKLVHPSVVTPWRHHNVRVEDPDGLQVTLFQIL
jgi:methylmalonyl-CoA/ethylmalonyl-CoA epimerase